MIRTINKNELWRWKGKNLSGQPDKKSFSIPLPRTETKRGRRKRAWWMIQEDKQSALVRERRWIAAASTGDSECICLCLVCSGMEILYWPIESMASKQKYRWGPLIVRKSSLLTFLAVKRLQGLGSFFHSKRVIFFTHCSGLPSRVLSFAEIHPLTKPLKLKLSSLPACLPNFLPSSTRIWNVLFLTRSPARLSE